jgi:hypothetical protein
MSCATRENYPFATVGVENATPYTETFTPQPASPLTSVCPTQQATIKITKTDGTATGDVNEPISIQPQDNNSIFRIVDCKYMYNLATSSLSSVGTYKMYAVMASCSWVRSRWRLSSASSRRSWCGRGKAEAINIHCTGPIYGSTPRVPRLALSPCQLRNLPDPQ